MKFNYYIILVLTTFIVPCLSSEKIEFQSRSYGGELHKQLETANRLVIRNSMGDQSIYCTVTNTVELAKIVTHINFKPDLHANMCGCYGNPIFDWYAGTNRISRIWLKHSYGFMMEDFYIGYLNKSDSEWFQTWLLDHGLTEQDIR